MKTGRPVHEERYKSRRDRIVEHCKTDSPMSSIPPIFVAECLLLAEAFYGGVWPMVYAVLTKWWYITWRGWVLGLSIWLTVRFGWTKWQHHPQTSDYKEYTQIHAKGCSPNCRNFGCHTKAVPSWFKSLFRWHTEGDEE